MLGFVYLTAGHGETGKTYRIGYNSMWQDIIILGKKQIATYSDVRLFEYDFYNQFLSNAGLLKTTDYLDACPDLNLKNTN